MKRKFKAIFGLVPLLLAFSWGVNAEPNPLLAGAEDFPDIAKKVYPSVVKVEARNGVRKVATGVVLDNKGHIVTTALISPRDERIYVTTSDGERMEAEFLGVDSQTHLAVVKVEGKNLLPIKMGSIKDLSPGSWIGLVSISPENTPAVSQGIVSSLGEEALRLNVWVVRGASGSPVIDKNGQMVGLLRGIYTDEMTFVLDPLLKQRATTNYVYTRGTSPSSGMAKAIPVDIVEWVFSEIKEKGKVERGWLGVSIGEDEEGRVEIINVEKESPAQLAELKKGDIVLEFEGIDVTTTEILADVISRRKPKETVTLKIERKGKVMDVKVKLGEYSKDELFKSFELRFPRLFPSDRLRVPRPPNREFRRLIHGFGERMYIGVYLQEISDELAQYFGVSDGKGLLVTKLSEGGPAEKAGLKVGDVIVKADGESVLRVSNLTRLIQEKEKGEKIELEIIRDKKKKTVEVEVAEEEGSAALLFSRGKENWARSYEEYADKAKEQAKKWQNELNKKYEENVLKLRKNLKKISEDTLKVLKEAQKKSNIEKSLMKAIEAYRGIKV